MATPDRDNLYTTDGSRTVYTRESNGTGWFVGIIVALALLAIGYLVFSANSGPSTTVDVNGAPAVESTDPALAPAPMTEAPAAPADAAPMTEAPAATDDAAAPAATDDAAAPAATAPADDAAAPAAEPVVQ